MKEPILSLVLCSRNDQYMGNSTWRLQTTLNYVAQKVYELGREEDVEVLVADWGSDTPLHTALELTPFAARIVAFVVVPPALALELQEDSPFSEVHALNAAVRRSRGQYIGRIDQDTLIGELFLRTFFELHEGNRVLDVPLGSALLFSNRRGIPYRFAVRCPSLWAVDRLVDWFGPWLQVENHLKHMPHLFYCSYVGMWLLHRRLWYECGGYDERLIYMNEMESDMAARLMVKYPMINLGELVDYSFYHLGHYHPRSRLRASGHRKVNPKRWHEVGEDYEAGTIHPNGEGWGLAVYTLDVIRGARGGSEAVLGRLGPPSSAWAGEIGLLLFTAGQVVLGRVAVLFRGQWRRAATHYAIWKYRAQTAWRAVRGEHLARWPGVLIGLWMNRGRRLSREDNSHVG